MTAPFEEEDAQAAKRQGGRGRGRGKGNRGGKRGRRGARGAAAGRGQGHEHGPSEGTAEVRLGWHQTLDQLCHNCQAHSFVDCSQLQAWRLMQGFETHCHHLLTKTS